jgi:hypothetical protein
MGRKAPCQCQGLQMEGKSHFGIKNEKRFGAHASLSRETSLFRFFKAGTLFTFRTCTLQRLSLDAKTIFSVKRQENCYNETAGDLIQCSSNNTGKIGTTVREHAKNCSTPSVASLDFSTNSTCGSSGVVPGNSRSPFSII